MSKLDDILEHTIYREGTGPNGSGGEFLYGFINPELDDRYSQIEHIPLKQALKDLILDRMDDIDPFHTADWYVKLKKKVEEL
jgi:hypothetical protein